MVVSQLSGCGRGEKETAATAETAAAYHSPARVGGAPGAQ